MSLFRWMRAYVSKLASALVSGGVCALAITGAAHAQDPTPPVFSAVDARGVDVATGAYTYASVDASVGTGGAGLAFVRYYNSQLPASGWRTSLNGTVNVSGSTTTVTLGNGSETFGYSGGVYTSNQRLGSTLTYASGSYTYTLADGTVAVFSAVSGLIGQPQAAAHLQTLTRPNGEKLTSNYVATTIENCVVIPDYYADCSTGGMTRLQSVTSNVGYMVHFDYGYTGTIQIINGVETIGSVSGWMTLGGATAINNAVDRCGEYVGTCPAYSVTWASAAYGYSGSVSDPGTVTPSGGAAVQYTYASNRLTGVKSPLSGSNDVTIAYNGAGQVSSVALAGVGTWTYAYTDNSPVTGQRTTTITAPDSSVRTVVSSLATGLVLSDTNEVNKTTTFDYDGYGRLTRATAPEGNYTQLTYDNSGNVTETRAVAKTGFGLNDIVTEAYFPNATFPGSCSNPKTCNQPTWVEDARGYRTDFTYDSSHGGVLTVTAPAPSGGTPYGSGTRPQTRFTYASYYAWYKNGSGTTVQAATPVYRLVETSACATQASCDGTADETVTTIGYGTGSGSSANNVVPLTVTTAAGNGAVSSSVTTAYTPQGDVATVDGPLSGAADTTRYYYGASRQVIGVVGPDPDGGGALKYRAQLTYYDQNFRATAVETGSTTNQDPNFTMALAYFTAAERHETSYDQIGRPVVVRLKDGGGSTLALTQMSYDGMGRPLCTAVRMNSSEFASPPSDACDDASGGAEADRITRTSYDAAGRVSSVQSAYDTALVQTTATYSYTDNGLAATLTDAGGNKTTTEYDGFDRVMKLRYPHPTSPGNSSTTDYEENTYNNTPSNDDFARLETTRRRDAATFTLDYDNLGRVTFNDAPGTDADITTTYDLFGRALTVNKAGRTYTSAYDQLSRLTSETPSHLGAVSYQYDAAGRRTRMTWPDSFYVTYSYNDASDLTGILENGSTSLASFAYDNAGRRTSLTRGNGVVTSYAYDAVSRLASLTQDASGTSHDNTIDFSYNSASQISSRTRTNSAYDWTVPGSSGTTTVNYTDNGLNQYTSVGGVSPTYDSRGNLTGDGSATYGYDVDNQLITRSGGAQVGYDPYGRLLHVYSGSGNATWFLQDGTDVIAEYDCCGAGMLRRYVHGPGVDEPLVWYEGSGTSDKRWLMADERGSIVAVTNASGAVTNVNTYDEYGKPASGNTGRFQYTGQMWLAEIGLYHYKARAYHPGLGRFLQTDPIGIAGGMNMYGYASGDPVNRSDPSGLEDGELDPENACTDAGYCHPVPCLGTHINSGRPCNGGSAALAVWGGGAGYALYAAGLSSGGGGSRAWRISICDDGSCSVSTGVSQWFGELYDFTFGGLEWSPSSGCGRVLYYISGGRNCESWGEYLYSGAEELWLGCLEGFCEGIGPAVGGVGRVAGLCGCFEGGELVATPDGPRPIEEIAVGDLVLAWNEDTGEVAPKAVTALIRPEPRELYALTLADAQGAEESFSVTDDHPWMVKGNGWVETIALQPGDRIETTTDETLTVASLAFTGEIAQTYNLEVDGWHTFLVGDDQAVVHNAPWSCGRVGNWASNALAHFGKHGAQFGSRNSLEYVRAAQSFVRNPPAGTLTKFRANGDTLFYNIDSNTFAVMNSAGEVRTMFKPWIGEFYWYIQ